MEAKKYKSLPVIIALLTIFAPQNVLPDLLDTWHSMSPWPQGISLRVSYGNGLFVGVGEFGALYTSADGSVWNQRHTGTAHLLRDAAYGRSTFVVAGIGGIILTSQNGETWTSRNSGTSHNLNGMAYGENTFVAVGDSGSIVTSPQGTDWTVRDSGMYESLKRVTFGNDRFVAVGVNGTILTSDSGAVWTAEAAGMSNHLEGIAYGNNTFVAVGEAVLASSDGIAWMKRDPGTNHRFSDVAYGNGTFAAVGENGALFTSPDGSVWTRRDSGTPFDLFTIAHGGGRFVAAGEGGTLLQSDSLPSPEISVSPASLDFGAGNVGSSIFRTLTITNSGSAGLHIERVTISGPDNIDFILQDDQCTGTTIQPKLGCKLQVAFSPHTAGFKSATLSISSNDGENPTVTVPLSGSSNAFVPHSDSSHCLISWLVDGSGLEHYLETFRRFRDLFLLENRPGRAVVDFYYRHSPSTANLIAWHEFPREILCWGLIPPLASLCYAILNTSPPEKLFFLAFIIGGLRAWLIRRSLGVQIRGRQSV